MNNKPQPALYGRMPYGGVYFSPQGEASLEMHVINANVKPENKLGAPYAVAMITLTQEQANRLAAVLRDVINGNRRIGQVPLPEGVAEDKAPEKCPICGAVSSKFKKMD